MLSSLIKSLFLIKTIWLLLKFKIFVIFKVIIAVYLTKFIGLFKYSNARIYYSKVRVLENSSQSPSIEYSILYGGIPRQYLTETVSYWDSILLRQYFTDAVLYWKNIPLKHFFFTYLVCFSILFLTEAVFYLDSTLLPKFLSAGL